MITDISVWTGVLHLAAADLGGTGARPAACRVVPDLHSILLRVVLQDMD